MTGFSNPALKECVFTHPRVAGFLWVAISVLVSRLQVQMRLAQR